MHNNIAEITRNAIVNMNIKEQISRIASKLGRDMLKQTLVKPHSGAPTKNKTVSIQLSEEQESLLATHYATASLHGQSVVKVAMNKDGCMDITTITPNRLWSDGSAQPATPNGTKKMDQD